ncbi:MAG TPA: hypothetical protein VMC48_04565 [Methanobacterium sp.]|nr:hypothetical protein [Methanobacterium sp.]
MLEFNFSDKLNGYLDKIQRETGREIKFLESSNLGIGGITAAYRYHPQYILIILNNKYARSPEDVERSIAHEATHGYLIHKLGFCRTEFSENVDDAYKRDVQLVLTMVEDIVVNRIISENSFPPFGHEYLPMVKEEIRIAQLGEKTGEEFYHKFAENPHLEALLMISRYIIAWGFLKFYLLNEEDEKLIRKFTAIFREYYPDYYTFTVKIVEILEKKDFFHGTGECEAAKDILKYLKMDYGVKLVKNYEERT